MDPLTITATCISLVSTIGQVSLQINTFVRQVRDARQDLDAVSRELHSLETILNIMSDEDDNQEKQAALPINLVAQITGIMSNCGGVLAQIQASLAKHGGGGLRKGIKWTISGREDMDKLRSSLEAHKSALGLTLDFATQYDAPWAGMNSALMRHSLVTREIVTNTQTIVEDTAVIRDDTLLIRGDTAVIKEDNVQILSEIAKLQARLPVERQSSSSTGITLQRYLDNLSSYAESSCDVVEAADAWEKTDDYEDYDNVSEPETVQFSTLSRLDTDYTQLLALKAVKAVNERMRTPRDMVPEVPKDWEGYDNSKNSSHYWRKHA
jgi:Fungal N-terminal domain of STAND proteins